jgi:hypothetical protein
MRHETDNLVPSSPAKTAATCAHVLNNAGEAVGSGQSEGDENGTLLT